MVPTGSEQTAGRFVSLVAVEALTHAPKVEINRCGCKITIHRVVQREVAAADLTRPPPCHLAFHQSFGICSSSSCQQTQAQSHQYVKVATRIVGILPPEEVPRVREQKALLFLLQFPRLALTSAHFSLSGLKLRVCLCTELQPSVSDGPHQSLK